MYVLLLVVEKNLVLNAQRTAAGLERSENARAVLYVLSEDSRFLDAKANPSPRLAQPAQAAGTKLQKRSA